jgi:hypothetical protein
MLTGPESLPINKEQSLICSNSLSTDSVLIIPILSFSTSASTSASS